ncbi:3-hydroxymethylcephem carbamoyltransferase [Streptomonospora sp. PA3]|uniref:carbamoyltransferase C-terminal domain-containing protein n=1 Tax=Streptomonospora sp. PA3 TaxID=2607326 RepID=UPI0012DF249D|nr:carbamoyltransferase C-terminal domain-containing protein [Streptomonospora sp. PA3]MUL41990.1 3-hydroxymethylcephem carbamoyltransferase [Streptomonospora sp. PA3]
MLIAAFKPGHDGSVAVVEDGVLVESLEAEKDSFPRHSPLTPAALFDNAESLDRLPDVFALGGWQSGKAPIGAGYHGTAAPVRHRRRFFGRQAEMFSSSHVRSHIMMAVGMAPRPEPPQAQVVLVWEGVTGAFYLLDEEFRIQRELPVLEQPGARYAFLFALADPTFPDEGAVPDLSDSGKLMALAAYGDAESAGAETVRTVERILQTPTIYPAPKGAFADSPVYNSGVRSQVAVDAAALLSDRLFDTFFRMAKEELPPGLPLRISGGCGLNCEWNARWRFDGHFSSVFVPPCTNDSGSAIGTAADAQLAATGDPHIDWSVYSGREFVWDRDPDGARWHRRSADLRGIADALGSGRVVAWVQGRWEIGPRALGNRSLLAEPRDPATRDRLNRIKQREDYRPIAPCCRVEDTAAVFAHDFPDPYMLYFREFRTAEYGAVTHVDGSARVQTVGTDTNPRLHALLSAFAERTGGPGMLCNTSLNFKGSGFINRMSDLVRYCEDHGVDDMVVGETWFHRTAPDRR